MKGCEKNIDGWNRCGVMEMGGSLMYCDECNLKPITLKLKWVSVYYPAGKWVDENDQEFSINTNKHCKLGDRELIMINTPKLGGGGHGEPRFAAAIPVFYDKETLEQVNVGEQFVTFEFGDKDE